MPLQSFKEKLDRKVAGLHVLGEHLGKSLNQKRNQLQVGQTAPVQLVLLSMVGLIKLTMEQLYMLLMALRLVCITS